MKRFLAIVVVVLLVAAGAGYLVMRSQQRREVAALTARLDQAVAEQRQRDGAVARDLAQDMARTLAATVAGDLAAGDADGLNAELADVVQGRRVTGVIVLDPAGKVVASTDLRYRDRVLDDEATRQALAATAVTVAPTAPAPGQLEVDAPVERSGAKVGVLRVFVDLGELTGG